MKFFGKKYDSKTKHTVYYFFGIKISKKDKLASAIEENKYLIDIINRIGADKIPPATGDLRQWQLELLDLMKDFDKVCRENGVQYWLDFGTRLGAIRHKGFIPWDDDIDTSMLKSDLDKILPILEEYFKDKDFIIRKRAESCNNFQIRIRHKCYNLGIDIFQVYEYPESELTPELGQEIIKKIMDARKMFDKKYHSKFLSKEDVNKAEKDIIRIQNEKIIPPEKEFPKNPILFHGIDFPYLKNEYVIQYDNIFPLSEIEFEGYKFYAPNKSQEYVESLWESWKDIPGGMFDEHEHYFPDYQKIKDYKDGK